MDSRKSSIRAGSFEDVALLHLHGFSLIRSEVEQGRVFLVFSDSSGKGERLLQEHSERGVGVNSRDFSDALIWAKNRVFSVRRSEGLGR